MNGVVLHTPRFVLGDLLLTQMQRHPAVATLIAAGAYVAGVPVDTFGLIGITVGYLLGMVAAAADPPAGYPGAALLGRRLGFLPRWDR